MVTSVLWLQGVQHTPILPMKLSAPLANERRLDAAIAAFIAEVKACEAIDQKFHIMDQNRMLNPIVYEIVPELEALVDYQPTDDEINAPLHA